MRAQTPIALDDESEPEPDVAVVPGQRRDYTRAHPANPVLIVNLSSIYGLVGKPRELGTGLDPYVHSKGGVVQLTRDMAVHFAREGVRVTPCAPGSCLPTSRRH